MMNFAFSLYLIFLIYLAALCNALFCWCIAPKEFKIALTLREG